MPIEDVDYLRQHSSKQSYMFLIDSKDRDRITYPTPSQYVVNFSQPFHNVIGFEVIDATIPRTMYNVDVYNNELYFFIHDTTFSFTPFQYAKAVLEPGDYSVQTLLVELNRVLVMNLNNDPLNIMAYITAESFSNPASTTNLLKFYSAYPFEFDMERSTIAETIGFDLLASPTERVRYLKHIDSTSITQPNEKLFHSVDKEFRVADIPILPKVTLIEGPRSVVRALPLTSVRRIAQRFSTNVPVHLTEIFLALTSTDANATSLDRAVQWEIRTGTSSEPGHTIQSKLLAGNCGIQNINGNFSSTMLASPLLVVPNTIYWIVVYNEDNENASLFYNNLPSVGNMPMRISTDAGISWTSQDLPDIQYQACVKLVATMEYHQMVAPGIFNLVGERYVTLRCDEIEENSFRSLAYSKHHLGLAKFRLGVVGYSENRVDFNKVPLREFHPIGKLTRLTLRFETPLGKLYDFKGINHTLTVAIHYLEPEQKERFEKSILNGNYRGNFLEYMYRENDQEEDSDDQEEDYSRDVLTDFRKIEQQYHPDQLHLQNWKNVYCHPKFKIDDEYESDVEL